MSSPVSRDLLLAYLADPTTFTLVDARTPAEFADAHIAGAVNVTPGADEGDFGLLPANPDTLIVVYCRTGKRAATLRSELLERGYTNVRVLEPARIVWFDRLAVFNCGVDAATTSPSWEPKRISITARRHTPV